MLARALPALLLSAFALAGCSGDDDVLPNTVELSDQGFDPKSMTVDAGTEVHFEVDSDVQNPHTVTIHKDMELMNRLDESVQAGQDTHYEFAETGTYHVYCKNHGTPTTGMHMVVTVE